MRQDLRCASPAVGPPEIGAPSRRALRSLWRHGSRGPDEETLEGEASGAGSVGATRWEAGVPGMWEDLSQESQLEVSHEEVRDERN